jgi:hypothetical protein
MVDTRSAAQALGERFAEAGFAVIPALISRSVSCLAGAAVGFPGLTLHASHPNSARRDRYALANSYKDAAADDPDCPAMTAAAVVRGHGR